MYAVLHDGKLLLMIFISTTDDGAADDVAHIRSRRDKEEYSCFLAGTKPA